MKNWRILAASISLIAFASGASAAELNVYAWSGEVPQEIIDDFAKGLYPKPSDAVGQDPVYVGRIREDESIENGINLWVVADNIRKGFHSTLWGFVAIAAFMCLYYMLFGLVSVLALGSNLLLLVALLSLLQATLTLPGIAAIALTLGMAIDANVLINERVREELRNEIGRASCRERVSSPV